MLDVEEAIELLGPTSSDANETETQMLAHHRRPMSIVYVVEPGYFRFSVQSVAEDAGLCAAAARQSSFSQMPRQSQNNYWTLETGKKYNLFLDLYDQNNHRIFPADNVRVSVIFPDGAFDILAHSQNGTAYTVVPLKTGTLTIKASLEGVMKV